jgi:hypothetical protein
MRGRVIVMYLVSNLAWLPCQAHADSNRDLPPKLLSSHLHQVDITDSPLYPSCVANLSVKMLPVIDSTTHSFTVHLKTLHHPYAGINVNLLKRHVYFAGPHDIEFTIEGAFPPSIDCHGLHSRVGRLSDHHRGTHLDFIVFPSCSNGLILDFYVSGPSPIDLDMRVDTAAKITSYVPEERWSKGCQALEDNAHCRLSSTVCDMPDETRLISGNPVFESCWREIKRFDCS